MRVLFLIIGILFINNLSAQYIPDVPSNKPKLIVMLVVDQMRYDYLAKFKPNFGKNGFNKLLSEGSLCANTQHEYLLTQQLPGYATIVTGTTPSLHGITSNTWYTRIKNGPKQAGADEQVTALSESGKGGNFSPKDLLVTTLSDQLALSNYRQSKIHSIAFDGQAAAIAGGHAANGAWWFDFYSGNWLTSSYYCDSLPAWLVEFNNKKLPEIYVNREWSPQKELTDYQSGSDKNPRFITEKLGFLYDLLDLKRVAQNYKVLTRTPLGNTFTLDFAKQVIINDTLGKDAFPDFLCIGLNPIGVINQEHSPLSMEIEDAYMRLDEDLGQFLNFLDAEIGMKDVLFVLTSDRGSSHNPAYLEHLNLPSGVFDQNQLFALSKSYLNVIYGQGEWITAYNNKQFYLNHTYIEDAKLSLPEVQERLARFSLQFSGVVNAVTASTLQSASFNHGNFELIQNSYHQKRSGDVILNLEPGWIEKSDYLVQSNSGYNYDTHVPLIWYGWKMPRVTIYRQISTTSIAATIAAFLEVSPPGGSSGEIINELMQKSK